jgi:AraC family transcriptional regulator, transcriptional activator FtrA
MIQRQQDPPYRVAVLVTDQTSSFEIGMVTAVFGPYLSDLIPAHYELRLCAERPSSVPMAGGAVLTTRYGLRQLRLAHTIIVPSSADPEVPPSGALVQELRAAHRAGARIVSTCMGAFTLAAAGLLDGRPATTHWRYTERFSLLYPQVKLDPAVLFVDDGAILTSAGVGAGVDLCLHVVRRDHGSEVANRVARRNVVAPWREGGQSQFVERPVPEADDIGTAETRAWAAEHLAEPLTLADLAAHARMSVRTFTRRFREETGISPLRWLAGQRIALARQLLESTDATVDRVAAEVGFGTPASLRQHLRAAIGVAPLAYRRTFRGVGVTGPSPVRGMRTAARLVR